MARLIEVDDIGTVPPRFTIATGDVLQFTASGGRIAGGNPEALQLLGSFVSGFIAPNAQVITPQGPPTAVLFAARAEGSAIVEIMTGDPYHSMRTTRVEIVVMG